MSHRNCELRNAIAKIGGLLGHGASVLSTVGTGFREAIRQTDISDDEMRSRGLMSCSRDARYGLRGVSVGEASHPGPPRQGFVVLSPCPKSVAEGSQRLSVVPHTLHEVGSTVVSDSPTFASTVPPFGDVFGPRSIPFSVDDSRSAVPVDLVDDRILQ